MGRWRVHPGRWCLPRGANSATGLGKSSTGEGFGRRSGLRFPRTSLIAGAPEGAFPALGSPSRVASYWESVQVWPVGAHGPEGMATGCPRQVPGVSGRYVMSCLPSATDSAGHLGHRRQFVFRLVAREGPPARARGRGTIGWPPGVYEGCALPSASPRCQVVIR